MNPVILAEQRMLAAAGFDPGPLDGILGPRTLRARLAYLASQAGQPVKEADSSSARLYAEALKYRGLAEQPGPGTNPVLAQMFALAPDWLSQDDSVTSWCGIFRGFLGHRTATGMPAEHYRAAAWLKWGRSIQLHDARPGDTAIFTRPGGNHVALVARAYAAGDAMLMVIGGNQSNAVTVAGYPVASLRGIRRA